MLSKTLLTLFVAIFLTTGQAFANSNDASAPAKKPLSVTPRHYLPSPNTGASYAQTAAAEAEVSAHLPKIAVAGNARVTPTAAVYITAARYVVPAETRLPLETRMSLNKSLKGYSTGSELIDSFIVDSSRRYSIDPLLIYSQMNQESSFKLRALSKKGASGLMQLMPFTAKRMGVTNIYDPQQNIEGGVKYMRVLLNMFDNDLVLALAGYNAGEGAVIKYNYQVPPYKETIDYVRRITARYRSITGR
ncbi:MAG TPA: lytic transglycosylase domain-containing protein [Pyrinomonadaceae bacterium]|nr:lytic transglycosylase domain-containing protein [Pyrinomonadaceae bacterium]